MSQITGKEANMFTPKIIVADKDHISRSRMAKALSDKAYSVETTGSVAQLLQQLLRSRFSVVVLGNCLEEGMTVATLIRLLKSCTPQLSIILVADDVSPAEERSALQQGIFYRASRPNCPVGWKELQLAVACACKKIVPAIMSCTSH